MRKRFIAIVAILAASLWGAVIQAYAAKMNRPITAWPLIYYRGDETYANADVLWPIFRFERKDTWNRLAIRPFIFATQKDTDYRKTNILWPLTGYERFGDKDLSLYVFPFYWYRKTLFYNYNVFFPFYWKGNYSQSSYLHIWPFYGKSRKGTYQEYSTIYPFFKYGYDEQAHYRKLDLCWPLFNFRKDDHYNSLRLFPVISAKNDYNRDYRHVSVLLFLSDYKRSRDGKTFYIFPVFWHGRDGTHSYTHIWPLFGKSTTGSYKEYSTLYPFFRYGVDSLEKSVTWHAFWPLAKYERAEDYLYFRFFPLVYMSHRGLNKTDLILPFYYRKQNEQTDFSMITPLFISRETAASKSKFLIPLYYHYQDTSQDMRLVVPFYYSKVSPAQSLKMLMPLYFDYQQKDLWVRVGLPLLFQYHKGPFSFSTFAPVYFHSEDKKEQSSFSYFFPFYGIYRRRDVITRHFLLFPLYSRLYDQKLLLISYDGLWPLFHYEKSPQTFSVRALPFYLHHRTKYHYFTAFVPFYWRYRGENIDYLHLLPFYSGIKKGDTYSKKFILGPLYVSTYDKSVEARSLSILFPLFHYDKEGKFVSSWLLPLYFYRGDAVEKFAIGSFFLLPPYLYYEKNNYAKALHLWPFYGRYEQGSYKENSTIWPLFRIGRDTVEDYAKVHLLLYYHERDKGDYTTTFFPLFKSTKEGLNIQSWLFPIYYHSVNKQEKETFGTLCLLPPYFYRFDAEQKKILHVWPLFGKYQKENYKEYSTVWPLFRVGKDELNDYRKLNLLLYYYRRDKTDTFTTIFPLWWHQNNPERRTDNTLLLYNYKQEGERKSLRLFWFIFREISIVKVDKSPEKTRNSFFPLYHYNKNGSETNFHIAYAVTPELSLFGVNRRKDYNKTFLFPLYHYNSYKADKSFRLGWLFYPGIALFRYDHNGYAKMSSLFPLYSYKHVKGDKGVSDRTSKEFRILWRLVRSYRTASSYTFEFNPLYYYEQKEGEGSYWGVLGGLFGLETNPDKTKRVRLLWIF